MSTTDKRLRRNSMPFQGKHFSGTSAGGGSYLIDGIADGDLYNVSRGSSSQVRIARPAKGDLIEARLTMLAQATVATTLRIFIGRYDTNGITPLTLTEAQKALSWKKLSGRTAAISYLANEQILIDGLDLMPDIPTKDSSEYNEDGFIIGIEINGVSVYTQFALSIFKVDASVQMAEVQK